MKQVNWDPQMFGHNLKIKVLNQAEKFKKLYVQLQQIFQFEKCGLQRMQYF